MNALFRWLDVDRAQWRALVLTSLKVDFEALRTRFRAQTKSDRGPVVELIVVAFLYLFSGMSPAWFALVNPDPLFGATMLALIVGFMVMSTLLIGEGVSIASPDDYAILGHRPVTSRTYLAVRVAALLVRTVVICTLISTFSIGVHLFFHGFHPERAIAALFIAYLTGLAVTLAIVGLYGWVLRLAGPARLMRWSSYMQFVAQTITMAGFLVSTQQLGKGTIAGIALTGTAWQLAFPGAWFGSWMSLAGEPITWRALLPALLSLATVALLGRTIGGKLALGYSETLAHAATSGAPVRSEARAPKSESWLRWLSNETRAIAILVRSHFSYDMKFRLGIISLVPITLIYMWMGGWPQDPLAPRSLEELLASGMDATRAAQKINGEFLVIMALMFLPLSLRRIITMSTNYRASWIYHVTPSRVGTLVLSTRSVITAFFLLPYLLFLGALFLLSFANLSHAVIHTVFMGLLAFNALQFTLMMDPQLPFSLPAQKDAEGGIMIATMLVSLVFGVGLYFLLVKVVYRSAALMGITAASLVVLAFLLDRLTRWRATKRLAAVGYVG